MKLIDLMPLVKTVREIKNVCTEKGGGVVNARYMLDYNYFFLFSHGSY